MKKIEDMGLSVRTKNALLRGGINTDQELYALVNEYGSDVLLKTIRSFGEVSMNELKENKYTSEIFTKCNKKFNKGLYEADKDREKLNRLKELVDFKRESINKLRREIRKLEKEIKKFES